MNMTLKNIALDESIQCRKEIDETIVAEYAERMIEGDTFPPVTLFGTEEQAWPGDGWHRIRAALKVGYEEIPATVNPGGRKDAVKFALKANGTHGLRRTNADKRQCIEIALREFGDLSSRSIAEMCGVDDKTVAATKNRCGISAPAPTVTGADGKTYLAKQPVKESEAPKPQAEPPPEPATVFTPKPTVEAKPVFQLLLGLRAMGMGLSSLEKVTPDPAEYAEIRELCAEMTKLLTVIASRCELEVAHAC